MPQLLERLQFQPEMRVIPVVKYPSTRNFWVHILKNIVCTHPSVRDQPLLQQAAVFCLTKIPRVNERLVIGDGACAHEKLSNPLHSMISGR